LREYSPAVDGLPNLAQAEVEVGVERGRPKLRIPAETLTVIR